MRRVLDEWKGVITVGGGNIRTMSMASSDNEMAELLHRIEMYSNGSGDK